MPFDINAVIQSIPEALGEDQSEERPHGFDDFETEPVLIWDPLQAGGLHPLDAIDWIGQEDDAAELPSDEWIDGQLHEIGLDLLAWYRSFHTTSSHWGIYIREWGLAYLARRLGDRRDLALRTLWSHEYFHFLTDIAATSIEISAGTRIYIPYLGSNHRGWAGCHLGEALANAYALEQCGRRHGKAKVRAFMRRQPVGYRDFSRYERRAGNDGLAHGYRELAEHFRNLPRPCRITGLTAQLGELLVDEDGRAVLPADVPVYFVPRRRSVLSPLVRYVSLIPEIAESPSFARDMRRLPRDLRGRWESVKEALGRSTRGSGVNFEKLRGYRDRFSVRLDRSTRVILRLDEGKWTAIGIGPHERGYRSARR